MQRCVQSVLMLRRVTGPMSTISDATSPRQSPPHRPRSLTTATVQEVQPVTVTSTTADQSEFIECGVNSGIRTIRLNRPKKKNALTPEMYLTLSRMLSESNSDDATNVVVLTGTGDYFTSGNDMNSYKDVAAKFLDGTLEPAEQPKSSGMHFMKLIASLIDLRKPLIALVNGPAVGIGTTLLGLCDSAFCTDRATFHTPFSALGIPPECCSSYTFPRIMGHIKATEMLAHNVKFTAQEALQCRLVTCVFPEEKFQEESWKRVHAIAQLPAKSLVLSKDLIRGPERATLHKVSEAEVAALDIMHVIECAAKTFKW